jgi:hypothetical protein
MAQESPQEVVVVEPEEGPPAKKAVRKVYATPPAVDDLIAVTASAKLGRPTLATPETVDYLLATVAKGVTWMTAAASIGISRKTLVMWRKNPQFDILLRAARAKGEIALVESVAKDPDNSKGAQFILERSYYQRWRRRNEVSVKTDPIDNMTAEELRSWVASVAKDEGIK